MTRNGGGDSRRMSFDAERRRSHSSIVCSGRASSSARRSTVRSTIGGGLAILRRCR